MTTYNFTTAPKRLTNHSVKWQATETDPDLLPMWIADMDFETFPEMTAAIKTFADYGIYGYAYAPKSLYDAIVSWEKSQHHYAIADDDIVLIGGVVPAITIAIQAFTEENDAVLINTPLYPPFARTIKLNNRKLVTNSLVEVAGKFTIDFAQLEKDIVDNDVKLYAFCSPHNPGGRVWTVAELTRIAELCKKYHVTLIADEIHQDLTLFDHQHHSFNTVGDYRDFAIVLTSATKTFNIAGTGTAYALIQNEDLKQKFKARQLMNNQHEVTTLGMLATETALTYGAPWLAALKPVLEENLAFLTDYFASKAPRIKVMQPEGGYLVWLDFSDYGLEDQNLHHLLKADAKVILNEGTNFGVEGVGHARLNIAAPLDHVKLAAERIAAVLPK
ncbi:MalY/PatB family protein [Lactococcus paracarnosus]|uniref:cysteine-S-conjugate beta-lyase n=1 Tax=Pseudolactococcus paracarnosus TaxID=2749962 RepID=A0ABT0AM55_9LACT|nr:MalY/PatB family protein [Lactococcus paracarnosus]MCJ1977638.1 pyridoxal phosphate-dependent aminotransferase [Lactococcus paracarnosus]MCJ1983781.1 pyridoxal phosphate-dependent aminotransferase [Lactococcus paracarnosus]MCJ1997303.1 pyridoxal phosphate-dependent aminotransferase [Lactococcus paracarnosus]